MTTPSPISWTAEHAVRVLDQTLLPDQERHLVLDSVEAVAEAIETLRVRGAPLIGIAAAMGVVQATAAGGLPAVHEAITRLGATRPTAVNLRWALDRMARRAERVGDAAGLRAALIDEATRIHEEDRDMCRRIGEAGLALLPAGGVVLTHCNAGALATGGIGTALAPLYLAAERGRPVHAIATETRPLLQGSRLTAWELQRAGIPCTLNTDNMVASRLRLGGIACVIVGADRIAANGDAANKIGTYGIALAAKVHGIPFFVAAPSSTVDLSLADGSAIPIEERAPSEVTGYRDRRAAPEGVGVWNPAFDVTPAELIAAFVTDRGVIPPAELAARLA